MLSVSENLVKGLPQAYEWQGVDVLQEFFTRGVIAPRSRMPLFRHGDATRAGFRRVVIVPIVGCVNGQLLTSLLRKLKDERSGNDWTRWKFSKLTSRNLKMRRFFDEIRLEDIMSWNLGKQTPETSDLDLNRYQIARGIFQAWRSAKTPISLEGYLRRAETKGFMMFSQTYIAGSWVRIPVGRVRELEWMGQEMCAGDDFAHVRLII
jgi:hypothetical protein